MRIDDIIYFSPSLKLEELDLNKKDLVLVHFKERIEDYYFKPIRLLIEHKMAFSSGALECLLIDAFARYRTKKISSENSGVVKTRMVAWCVDYLKVSEETGANFYRFFRCGLIHEGHIKQFGQFCFDDYSIKVPIVEVEDYIIVNPKHLLSALESCLYEFIERLKTDENAYEIFNQRLRDDFEHEVTKAGNK